MVFILTCFFLTVWLAVASATAVEFNSTRKYVFDSQLPARLQWLPNSGYCGEVSLVMATLKKGGAYYSQYDARAISAVIKKDAQVKHFYLVGENDQRASDLLKMTYDEFDNSGSPDPKRYMSWIKKTVRAGHAVTITVFMNHKMFYGVDKDDAGEADYDHIVSMTRIESNYDDDLYHDDDLYTMEDHGLYAPDWNAQYYFTYTAKQFIATRSQANNNNNVYAIPDAPDYGNFGIAHIGVVDTNKDCLPLLVETSLNYEKPAIKNNSEDRPESMSLTLTVTVSGLESGVAYVLYTYNDETAVPTEAFNAAAAASAPLAVNRFTASGPSFQLTENIQSNDKRIYRAVATSAK